MKISNITRFAAGALLLGAMATSCSDFLDTTNNDLIDADDVWKDPTLVKGVMANLYTTLNTEDLNSYHDIQWRLINYTTLTDDAQGSFQKDYMFDNYDNSWTYGDDLYGMGFEDTYRKIRRVNQVIIQLENTKTISEVTKAEYLGEARFIRAFIYFSLVKRYGGVPLLTSPQEFTSDYESLRVPRAKEAEVYDFIIKECMESAEGMTESYGAGGEYRANRYAAYALASRAALYAGSIAKYGTQTTENGEVGIPTSSAAGYYQKCIEASNKVINSGKYSLYLGYPNDRVKNFQQIFTYTTNGKNGEYIFWKAYEYAFNGGHDFAKRNAVPSHANGGWGCGTAPTLEFVEAFDYVDGTPGKLKVNDESGNPIGYNERVDIFANKDPRLLGSVYVPGGDIHVTNFKPEVDKVEWQRGVIDADGNKNIATKNYQNYLDEYVEYNGVKYPLGGADGGADNGDASKTGFYQKKFFDENIAEGYMNMGMDQTPWPIFRLAEMYLNLAEAAFETGDNSTAVDAINVVRERAGVAKRTSLTLEQVRNERRCELCFENHRYWDLRRWRIASEDASLVAGGLNNFRGSALYPWYDVRDGKWYFEVGTHTPKRLRYYNDRNYYNRISSTDLNRNGWVQNPGFTN